MLEVILTLNPSLRALRVSGFGPVDPKPSKNIRNQKDLMTFALPAGMERDQSLLQLALLCLQQAGFRL